MWEKKLCCDRGKSWFVVFHLPTYLLSGGCGCQKNMADNKCGDEVELICCNIKQVVSRAMARQVVYLPPAWVVIKCPVWGWVFFKVIQKYQLVQDTAIRLLTRTSHWDHIALLQQFHGLFIGPFLVPVQNVDYKP